MVAIVRTTLTIDDRIARALKAIAHRSGRSFKEVVDEVLKAGLAARDTPPTTRPYRLKPASLGSLRPGIDLDKALQVADALEDEAIAHKLEMRK